MDQDGIVLDVLVQSRRDKGAAKRLLRKLLKRQCRSHAQRFLSAHDQINNLFLLPRHLMPATDYRAERARAFQAWHDVCGIKQAA